MNSDFKKWLADMPKAELHLHLDGSLQAHRLLSLASKNSVDLPYKNIEQVEAAYAFDNLQSFLDLYYLGASVLLEEGDFYHLMMDYLLKCKQQNVVHTEIMIEPQTYAPNGVSFATMMAGFDRAINEARSEWGQSALLILSFLRHLSEQQALDMLEEAKPFRHHFVAIGLASSEIGNPPEKFERLYKAAQLQGYNSVAHAGEEGPPQYVYDSLDILGVDRIDHGVRSIEDPRLMTRLRDNAIALTVCPLSNVRLCVFDNMADHNILEMLEQGIKVTVNSDDPAYFGGYMTENFWALAQDLNLSQEQALQLNINSFEASFLNDDQKQAYTDQLRRFAAA